MPPFSVKELEERLAAAGSSLLQPPSSLDELLPLLDQIEKLLSKVEQSPAQSMQTALSPLMKALVMEELLKHSDTDVKVGVASCISEITRITAPDAPYDDDKMKDVFQLIVSSFENLSDTSSRSYEKRATILETVAKVRSCVIMLDLECDLMIVEMFQHFLEAIRGDHAEAIFASMETIMTLVLEESEDISPDLLNPILATLKMSNEAVTPIAKELAERVIKNSADKLRPYLAQAIRSSDASFDDYGEVVASLCRENSVTVGNSYVSISRDQPVVVRRFTSASPAQDQATQVTKDGGEETNYQEKDPTLLGSSKSIASYGIDETGMEDIMTDANSSKKADSNSVVAVKPVSKTESDDCGSQNPVKLEAKAGHSKAPEVSSNHEISGEDDPISPTEAKLFEAAESLDKVEDTATQLSPLQTPENEAVNGVSPTQSGSLCDESRSKKDSPRKRKKNLVKEVMTSVDTASKKASGRERISTTKKKLQSGKKRSDQTTKKDKTLTEEGASKNDGGSTSDSEARSLEQTERLGNASNKTDDVSSMTKEDGYKKGRMKYTFGKDALKSSAREVHAKDTVTSPRSSLKSMKVEDIQDEIPRPGSKRKRTPGTEKASGTIQYGKNLVGSKVKVWWPDDQMYYEGVIASFDAVKKKHKVSYYDGDEEVLNLRQERWEFVGDGLVSDGDDVGHSSHDTSSEVPRKKKGNSNSETSKGKRQKSGSSQKSKLKDTVTKKSKDDGKPESEAKDKSNSKPSKRSVYDSQKLGGKSQASGGRSKDDSARTPKQDGQRSAAKSKGKSPQSGKTTKTSSPSKVRETDRKKEKPQADLAKSSETVLKVKSAETSKSRESETKSGKKRRRWRISCI